MFTYLVTQMIYLIIIKNIKQERIYKKKKILESKNILISLFYFFLPSSLNQFVCMIRQFKEVQLERENLYCRTKI